MARLKVSKGTVVRTLTVVQSKEQSDRPNSKLCRNLNTKEELEVLTVMDFSRQSLNPDHVEYLWGQFKTQSASQETLWETVKSCWDNMSHQVFRLECKLSLIGSEKLRYSEFNVQLSEI